MTKTVCSKHGVNVGLSEFHDKVEFLILRKIFGSILKLHNNYMKISSTHPKLGSTEVIHGDCFYFSFALYKLLSIFTIN